jgi:hypothetical protein
MLGVFVFVSYTFRLYENFCSAVYDYCWSGPMKSVYQNIFVVYVRGTRHML